MNIQNYNKLVQAINNGCNTLGITLNNTIKHPQPRQTTLTKILALQTKGCNKYSDILNCKTYQEYNPSHCEAKWHSELNTNISINNWNKYWQLNSKRIFNNQSKWIDYQILRHSLKTNHILHNFFNHIRDECPFCSENPDTISHTIGNCRYSSSLWANLKNLITPIYQATNKDQNSNNKLFGFQDLEHTHPLNIVHSLTRLHIWN